MKKLLLLLTLLPTILLASYDHIYIKFLNGGYVDFEAESYWTVFDCEHNCYKCSYFYADEYTKNEDYICINDYCCMNPVSHDTKEADYTNLRDKVLATGNECNYFKFSGNVVDGWCISMRYDEMESLFIRGDGYVYKDGNKYH